jgi:hypothetical protein
LLSIDPGITIITHGFQLGGGLPWADVPAWTVAMGQAILDRADGDDTTHTTGSMFKHRPGDWVNPGAGDWGPNADWWTNSNKIEDDIVLIYDW